MKRHQLILLAIGGIVVAILGAYALFALVLIGSDVASYSSDGVTVSNLEFEDVLAKAEAAGYTVERVESSGFRPEGIDELDAELGSGYEVFRIIFDHTDDSRIWATVDADEGVTTVTFFADDVGGPFTVEHLPPDDWVIDRFTLLFEMDEATSSDHLDALKADIRAQDPSTPGANTPTLVIDEPFAFQAVYADVTNRASEVRLDSTPGTGWHERRYIHNGSQIGGIDFVLPRATVTHQADRHTFQVHVDAHGGVSVGAETRAWRTLEEETVKTEIREMFVEMGIPPATIDHLHLEYQGSVW